MNGGGGDDDGVGPLPLFETARAKGRWCYRLYAVSVFIGCCLIWVYRATHVPKGGEGGRLAWICVFAAELWFGFYWFLTQSVRWNPVYRRTFKDRLSQRYEDVLPNVDVFVCTANASIEPPAMVINTVLSVMAYDYPSDKLAVYLSDDGCSIHMFHALLEASRFAKSWIPFCKKFKVEPRSPAAYFTQTLEANSEQDAKERLLMKSLYMKMENRINATMKLGTVSEEVCKQHKGFAEWNKETTSKDHQEIVEILIDGTDQNALDDEGSALPTLVYMAREKRPHRRHHFKAGAVNSLLRVSSEISNGAVVLTVDCDMYSNNSETMRDAMCFFMDEEKGHQTAYVQLPQNFNNITQNDIYCNSMKLLSEVDFHGFDSFGGPLYIGSGCYHKRESLCGKEYNVAACKDTLVASKARRIQGTSISELEARAKLLTSCTYEDNTEWGKEIGLKYGCATEDVITGLAINCKGWNAMYFNPPRMGYIGVAPMTLVDTLVQQKRWSEGDFQIFLSKYCPFVHGMGRIRFGLQLAYSMYCLWAPCGFPTLFYVAIPSLALFNATSLFPGASSYWFAPFAYVITVTTIYDMLECLWHGGTLKGWWNGARMWLFKRLASYPFAFIDCVLMLLGVNQSTFIVTSKVADEEVSERYKQEMMDFGSSSPMFTILGTVAMLNLVCLAGGLKMMVLDEGIGAFDTFCIQLALCGSILLLNIPTYQAMFFRVDNGRMPMPNTLTSVALALLAFVRIE